MVNTSLRYIKPGSDYMQTKARPLSTLNNLTGGHSMEDNFETLNNHYNNLKKELGYETVFDAMDTVKPLDYKYFTDDKPLMMTYKVIKDMGPTFGDTEWVTFTAVAKDGTVGELWKAGESLFQQAKLAVGDWHYFIEGFDEAEDGSLELVTGS